ARERRTAMRAGRLRNFVFMMRELQVDAAAMNVDSLAQMLLDHGRAFDMPAGTTPAPGALPARLIRRGGPPQHEIRRVLLVWRDFDARARDHLISVTAGKTAISGITRHIKKNMAIRRIGMASLDQSLHHRDHLGNGLRRLGLDVGPKHA